MPYTPYIWSNGTTGATPITAARLNAIEQGIANVYTTDEVDSEIADAVQFFIPFGTVAPDPTKTPFWLDSAALVLKNWNGSAWVAITSNGTTGTAAGLSIVFG